MQLEEQLKDVGTYSAAEIFRNQSDIRRKAALTTKKIFI